VSLEKKERVRVGGKGGLEKKKNVEDLEVTFI